MIEALKNSSIVWVVLAICSLIGIPSFIFAIYTWIKGKKKKRISLEKTSYRIVKTRNNPIDRLKLSFDGKEIEDVAITQIVIWNSGNEVIRREDLASERPLSIKSHNDAEILDVELLAESEPANNFAIKTISDNTAIIDFEYFDSKEGVVVQIIHNGSSSDVVLDCKIKGGQLQEGKKAEKEVQRIIYKINEWAKKHINNKVFLSCYQIILCVLLLFSFFYEIFSFDKLVEIESVYNSVVDPKTSIIIGIIATELMALLFIIFTIISIKRLFKMNIPSKLRVHLNAAKE